MTHEGGTVAGESPDKAEQQESSQEAPAGGGGRDPRLSVLRESASPATASPVQVDQPTAVFKSLAPRTPEDDAPSDGDAPSEGAAPEEPVSQGEAPSGDEALPGDGVSQDRAPAEEAVSEEAVSEDVVPEDSGSEEAGSGSEGAVAEGSAEGDRLRAAVAAWVASGDEEPTADAAGTTEAAEADADADVDAPARADAAAHAGAGAGAHADADGGGADEAAADDADEPASEAGKADASWFAARKPADEPEATQKPQPADAPEATQKPQPADAPEAAERPKAAQPPVDQPTAVFKAVRPPVAPAVDQPTTALKIPTPPPTATPPAPPVTPAAPKPAAERPSTFVPLRPDASAAKAPAADAPAAKAPEAKRPAPTPAAAPAPAAPPSLTEAERTRQQPMPPLPPLDLLAELTNTPPPPPTPLRNTMRRVRIWTPLVVLLLIVFAVVQFVRPLPTPALTLSAAPTFTFEGGELTMPWPTEGQGAVEVEGVGSLGTYGAQKPAPLASVAKTMTAYVILRDHPIKGDETGPEISIDKKAADEANSTDESRAPVKEGQTYTEKELLQLLMIPSANNVARRLARWDAGSEAAFVEKMNAAAKDLGMTESTYTDPSGLLATTVSTPKDQLKLAKAVMQYDVFREIVNMPNLTVPGIPGRIENNNKILLEPGVSGIKTGSSTPAGGNLLWSANTVVDGKNRRILGVVMGAKDASLLDDKLQLSIDYSLKLIQQAQKDVTSAAVVEKGQVVGYVDDGLGGKTPVIATKELKAVGWPGLKVDLRIGDGGKAVPHTGKAGDIVGQVSIGTGSGKVSAPLALKTDLVEPGFDKKLTRLG